MKNVFSKMNKSIFLMMSLCLSLVLITSCNKDDDDDDGGGTTTSNVVASFASQVDADNSLTYSFTNNSVVNGITDTSFDSTWDFGADGTSSDESPSYTFSTEGTYEVTLTVTATDGETATATETVTVTAPKNRYASLTDSRDDDNGELRFAPETAITEGRLTFMYRVAAGPDMEIQDGFVNISGTSTTGDEAIVEVRFKDNAPHEWREGASDEVIGASNFPVGMPDVWVPVELSWLADGVGTPTFTLVLDGQTIATDALSTTNGGDEDVDGHLEATMNGAANFQFKYSDKSKVSDSMMHVDDLVIYSSDTGSEVVVFEDNFQGRTAGDDLNPGEDAANPLTRYHENTIDCTVAEDE